MKGLPLLFLQLALLYLLGTICNSEGQLMWSDIRNGGKRSSNEVSFIAT